MTPSHHKDWQLTGNMAENYERYFVPAIFRPWASVLLDAVQPREGERVLDVGCGTGIVARLAAERTGDKGRVVGLDINPMMLAVASSAPVTGAPTEWRQASATEMPFEDGSFDVVLCQQTLQFIPDKHAAVREMRRVLVPDGRLAISVWRDIQYAPGYAALAEALERHVGPAPVPFIRMLGALGTAEELQGYLDGTGLRHLDVRPVSGKLRFPSPEEYVWQFIQATPLSGMPPMTEADGPTRAAVINDVSEALQGYADAEGLAFPIEAHIATARK